VNKNEWLKFGDVKRGTESTAVAAQNLALSTNCFKKKFWKWMLTVQRIQSNYWPSNIKMFHFGKEWICRKTW